MNSPVQKVQLPNPPPHGDLSKYSGMAEEVRRLRSWAQLVTKYLQDTLAEHQNQLNTQIQGVGDDIAAAATISVSSVIHHVTGTAVIKTIVPPRGFSGPIFLIPDGAWTLVTGGNIASSLASVVGNAVLLVYDYVDQLWYPQPLAVGPVGPPGPPGVSNLSVPPITTVGINVPDGLTQWTYYRGDTTTGDIIFSLPRAVGSGVVLLFSKEDSSANGVIPTPLPPDLLNGAASYTVNTQDSLVWITDADAGIWKIINAVPLS